MTEARAILEEYPDAALWQSWGGDTALYRAASCGSMQVLKLLLAAAPQAAASPCGRQRSTPAHAGGAWKWRQKRAPGCRVRLAFGVSP